MAYFAPYVDGSGLHIPTYNDILADQIEQAKVIFGQDIYLEPDSQDYQMIAVISSKIYDCMQSIQIAYNNRGPSVAFGSALDALVKLNGIKRRANETDAQLRSRQAISTAQPSRSILEGLKGAIADTAGVTRHRVYENDTNAVNSLGLPPNSITCIIEGGEEVELANVIYNKKGPGVYTNGDVVIDIYDIFKQLSTIRFYRPTYADISATITIKTFAGYVPEMQEAIQNSVFEYLNSLEIGTELLVSTLWWVALSNIKTPTKPDFSILSLVIGKNGGAQSASDIPINFNEVSKSVLGAITVVVT